MTMMMINLTLKLAYVTFTFTIPFLIGHLYMRLYNWKIDRHLTL